MKPWLNADLRLIIESPGSLNVKSLPAGPWHMARDEALLLTASRPTLRIYVWPQEEATLGYFTPTTDAAGVRAATRRISGGGLVNHRSHSQLTYSLVLPKDSLELSTPEIYCSMHGAIMGALVEADQGLKAQLRLHDATVPGKSGPCFVAPVAGDLMLGNRKIAGAAQRKQAWALLQQGVVELECLPEHLQNGFISSWVAKIAGPVLPQPWKSFESAIAEEIFALRQHFELEDSLHPLLAKLRTMRTCYAV
ncbi:MAG: biotin/lipoate A/B protein ligase family protein [Verrucomicrobiales bacterium]